jgi:hypothetical protein
LSKSQGRRIGIARQPSGTATAFVGALRSQDPAFVKLWRKWRGARHCFGDQVVYRPVGKTN